MGSQPHRRRFLGHAAIGAGLVGLGQVERAGGFAANETIHVACLGTGGRCRRLMSRLTQIPGVKIVGVADIWEVYLRMAKDLADKSALAVTDYRHLLDRKDVDAVVIAAPDHWHVPMTVDACEAGKDVYVEKPLTHDLSEGDRVIDAQNRNHRIVQVGTQQRSMPHLQEAREIIKSGELGPIYKIHMTWNRNHPDRRGKKPEINPSSLDWKKFLGNAPDQPFDAYRFRNWRWFWDFGGGIFTDLMVHWMDTAYWMIGMDDPASVMSIGDHFQTEGVWETPDTVQTLLWYPQNKLQAYFEGTFVNHHNRAMLELMGSEATLYVDRGGYEVQPQRHRRVKRRERRDGKGERGSDFFDEVDGALYHLQNWVDCIRSRQRPACPAEEGVRSAAAAHLANRALRSGQVERSHDPS